MADNRNNMSMSIKAFLLSHDGVQTIEVRRFGIPEGVSTNFEYLQQRVKAVFSLETKGNIKIFWEDNDEDRIIISSDDELLEAIAECICRQQQQLLRIYVTPTQDSNEDSKNKDSRTVHIGVVCDGCDQGIAGQRYKCRSCLDYDLCNGCKIKGIHSQHQLKNLGFPKGKFFTCSGFNNGENTEKTEEKFGMGNAGGFCPGRRGRNGRNRWAGRARRSFHGTEEGQRCAHPSAPTMIDLSECFEQFFPEEVRGRMEEANSKAAGHVADFMKNIWESWSGTFEHPENKQNEQKTASPGPKPKENIINIDIEMDDAGSVKHCTVNKTNNENKSSLATESSETTESSTKTSEKSSQIVREIIDQSAASLNSTQTTSDLKEQEQVNAETSQDVVMDTDSSVEGGGDWTLVNKDSPSRSSKTPEDDNLSVDDEIQVISPREMYPKLPIEPTSVTTETPSVIPKTTVGNSREVRLPINIYANASATSDEQRCANSLRYMENMGYSNEGGWLTRLLQLKKGDINQVLDILMGPNKK